MSPEDEAVVKYLVLLIGDGEVKPWSEHTPDEQAATMGRFRAFDEACAARPGVELLAGEALADARDGDDPAHARRPSRR